MAKTPNYQTRIEEEHRTVNGVEAKAVIPYVYDSVSGTAVPGGGALVGVAYDTVSYNNTSTLIDTYTYKTGGASGTTVATVTITFTDTTKAQFSTVVRT